MKWEWGEVRSFYLYRGKLMEKKHVCALGRYWSGFNNTSSPTADWTFIFWENSMPVAVQVRGRSWKWNRALNKVLWLVSVHCIKYLWIIEDDNTMEGTVTHSRLKCMLMWYDVLCYGIVWCGVGWYIVVWHGVGWFIVYSQGVSPPTFGG